MVFERQNNTKNAVAKCTTGACCFHLRHSNSITMLTTKAYESCIFYPTCASESPSTLSFKLTPVPLPLCLLLYFCSQKPKKKKKKKSPHPSPTYLNAYRQSTDTKASSACVYRAAAATLDPESQWAHSASDAHLFQGSQRATKQQTLIPV